MIGNSVIFGKSLDSAPTVDNICEFCGRGDKDFRDPKLYPLRIIVDPLDRDNFIYAHRQCIVDSAHEYKKLKLLKQTLRDLIKWNGLVTIGYLKLDAATI